VAFEGPAAIADWSAARGHTLAVTRLDRGEALPGPDEFDGLVVMGGPMSANDAHRHAWLPPERRALGAALEAGVPVLGVCLGAQLLAAAAGARVHPAAQKEIGWLPVRRVAAKGLGALLPGTFTPLHWHGETFELPSGATRLAASDAVPNQAFQLGERALGLQFHLEATPASVRALVAHAGHEIGDGPFEQPAEGIVGEAEARSRAVRPILFGLLDALFATPGPER
jgi:GMP synthase-like glutamine amidotransferase